MFLFIGFRPELLLVVSRGMDLYVSLILMVLVSWVSVERKEVIFCVFCNSQNSLTNSNEMVLIGCVVGLSSVFMFFTHPSFISFLVLDTVFINLLMIILLMAERMTLPGFFFFP